MRLAGAHRAAVAGALLVEGDVELVLRRRLPGDAAQNRVVPFQPAADAILGPIDPGRPLHDFVARRRAASGTRSGSCSSRCRPGCATAPAPRRHEEPQLVALDRAADARRVIEQLQRLVGRLQAAVLQLVDRFVASIAELANSPESIVRKVLPPSFGTMLTTMPSALVSAEMPLVDITISSTEAAFSW